MPECPSTRVTFNMEGVMKRMSNNEEVNRWRNEYYFKLRDCKKAMTDDYALSHAYNNHNFKDFMEQLIGTHGLEHVSR